MHKLTERLQALFLEASKLGESVDLEQWSREKCSDDEELRSWLLRLIQADRRSGDFLDSDCWDDIPESNRILNLMGSLGTSDGISSTSDGTSNASPELAPNGMLGAYRLIRPLDTGGMGVIWLAQQPPPIGLKVAIKVLRHRSVFPTEWPLIEAETNFLKRLDHPNIARILDGGVSEDGAAFLVMEYVDGEKLNGFLEANNLDLQQRMRLCLSIAQAVRHAHQRGVLHRDLKPSNVMVVNEPTGAARSSTNNLRIKLIDFGIASEMRTSQISQAGEHAEQSRLEKSPPARSGTIEYMAPEQLGSKELQFDFRSDVYGFGGIMYFAITGKNPRHAHPLRTMPREKAIETALHFTPELPSKVLAKKVSGVGEKVAFRAADLEFEVDWIVMKCLEKNTEDRYPTIDACIDDIERYLDGRPILARDHDQLYRWKKYSIRNKTWLGSGFAALLAMVLGMFGLAWGWIHAQHSLEIARKSQAKAESATKAAQISEQNATRQRLIADSVRNFLQSDLLLQADPFHQSNSLLSASNSPTNPRPNPSIRDLLDRVAQRIEPESIEQNYPVQPEVQAELLSIVGESYTGVGDPNKAIEFLKRATKLCEENRGAEHPDCLRTKSLLANALYLGGKTADALAMFQTILEVRERLLPADHRETLQSCNNVAWLLQNSGKLEEALSLYRTTETRMKRALGQEDPFTLGLLNNYATCLQQKGEIAEAKKILQSVFDGRTRVLGPNHVDSIRTLANLGFLELESGDIPLAIQKLETAQQRFPIVYPSDHPAFLVLLSNLALAYQRAGQNEKATLVLEKVIEIRKEKLGDEHPSTWISITNLALACQSQGQIEKSLSMFREANAFFSKMPENHPLRLAAASNLGGALIDAQLLEEAFPLLESTAKSKLDAMGADNPSTLFTQRQLGACLRHLRQFDRAKELLEQTRTKQVAKIGAEHLDTILTEVELAFLQLDTGDTAVASIEFRRLYELLLKKFGEQHPETQRVAKQLPPP